ncbi:UNVERIFIED_CONTAM: hypothetical protein FKN15_017599 [Acipenser sinensis]
MTHLEVFMQAGKLFWYQVHYDMHTRTHTHLYYCSQCSYSSITKNCLKRHVIQKHSNILLKCPTEYTTPDKYKPLLCGN